MNWRTGAAIFQAQHTRVFRRVRRAVFIVSARQETLLLKFRSAVRGTEYHGLSRHSLSQRDLFVRASAQWMKSAETLVHGALRASTDFLTHRTLQVYATRLRRRHIHHGRLSILLSDDSNLG